jgi:hypothetical protein
MTVLKSMDLKNEKIVIVIDNDECIGSWIDLSMLYSMFKIETKNDPNISMFVDIMEKTNCIRPYVKNLFEKIIKLKKNNIVYKIIMCTAASNANGWVTFLSKMLEHWFGEKIYDAIIHGELIKEWHINKKTPFSNNNGYIKNMEMITELFLHSDCEKSYKIIVIDDRPSNIIGGIVIPVSPFRVAINIVEILRLYLPHNFEYLNSKYNNYFVISWKDYKKNSYSYTNVSNDIDILHSISYINKIIYDY